MKNILAFYYSLHPEEIHHKDDKYFFEYMNNSYVFEVFMRPLNDIDALYNVNKQMIERGILTHEMIVNNENKILTYVNNVPYILMEINVNKDMRINLAEICYINNNSINIECDNVINRNDWVTLWEIKNDYFEAQINEIGKKYPNLCNYANYYIGLAENAISYVRNAQKIDDVALLSICHKRINYSDDLFSLYNPVNFICDYRVRDICEYIKTAFFSGDDAYLLIINYFKNNYLSYKEALLFYGRLLYPSYFFDLHDDIVNNNLEENIIEKIIIKASSYERFLYDVYVYISKLYNRYIPAVDWIIKRSFV